MLYGDIETEPIDKDWLFGFKDEINEADWMCIAPYEDEWEVVEREKGIKDQFLYNRINWHG